MSSKTRQSPRPPRIPLGETSNVIKKISSRLPPPPSRLSPLIPKTKVKMVNTNATEKLLPPISHRKAKGKKSYRIESNAKNNSLISRRLVEYFIIVSSVPREKAVSLTPTRRSIASKDEPSTPQSFEMEDDSTNVSTISASNNSCSIPESPLRNSQGSKNINNSPVSTTSTKTSTYSSHTPIQLKNPIRKLKNKLKFSPSPSDHSRYRKRRDYGNIQIDVENEKPSKYQLCLDFQPVITDRYPLKDYEDNPLNSMVSQFCFPNTKDLGLRTEYILPKIHHFVLTNDRGRKIYGTCMTIYEPYDISSVEDEDLQLQLEHLLEGHYMSDQLRYKEVYLPKCLCILSSWPYLTSFRTYLTQLYRLATTTDILEAPIERYIANICLEIPAPPPGAYEVQANIFSSTVRFWSPPANQPIAYVALPYSHLFSCLDIGNIIFVWQALAMERKVLLVSSQLSLLTICSELLLSFLFPFSWPHLYVPVLPSFLTPMLDAPMPYLCGISRKIFASAFLDLAEDVILVDLDKNEVTMGPETTELPDLPPRRAAKLQRTLENNVSDIFWRARCVSKAQVNNSIHDNEKNMDAKTRAKANQAWKERFETFDQAFELSFLPDSLNLEMDEKNKFNQEQSIWDTVQEAFLRFYVSIMKDYRKFMVEPSKTERVSGACIFHVGQFIESQPLECQAFYRELCHTQQFDEFITKRAYDPGQADVIFFNQSIDAKNNRSKMKMKKVETPFLRSLYAHKQLHTINAIQPNTSNIPKKYSFNYPIWPNKLNSSLFGVPRPIPKIINAEFDRQEELATRLRSNNSDQRDEFIDADPSPKVASYTLFFILYAATTGLEFCKFAEESAKEKNIKSAMSLDKDDDTNKSWNSQSAPQNQDRQPVNNVKVESKIDDIIMSMDHDDKLLDSISSIDSSKLDDTCDAENGIDNVTNVVLIIGSNVDSIEVSFKAESLHEDDLDLRVSDKTPKTNNTKSDSMNCNEAVSPVKNFSSSMIKSAINYTEREEAREVALAQLDLAFDILAVMYKQNIPAEPDVYKALIEASGRCGDTERATELMTKLNEEGIVPDTVLQNFFLKAFSMQNFTGLNYLPYASSPGETIKKLSYIANMSLSRDSSFKKGDSPPKRSNLVSQPSSSVINDIIYAWVDYGTSASKYNEKKKEENRKKTYYATESIATQLLVGQSNLERLYANLKIDTNIDNCPHCATSPTEQDIVIGWNPCNVHDYTVACPQCTKRFVPHFSVESQSDNFIGSQGKNTPLYCEFLSPWVLRKELESILNVPGGIENIIKPKWRQNADIQSTIWWNLILTFSRHRLPITFLLQGSVQNRLIAPTPSERM